MRIVVFEIHESWAEKDLRDRREINLTGGGMPDSESGEKRVGTHDGGTTQSATGAESTDNPTWIKIIMGAAGQTSNGTAEEAAGKDISGWVNHEDVSAVTFSLKDIAAYRTSGASKAMPGFDVIDYGQEDYVFGNTEKDARH